MKRKKGGRLFNGIIVVLGAIGLTTLAIHASDSLRVPGSSLLAGVGKSTPRAHCPEEMVYIPQSGGGFCIDRYEAAPGERCFHKDPMNQFETKENLTNSLCVPISAKEARPWVNVPLHDALALCAKVGKRLPSNSEWYRAALGTPDVPSDDKEDCVLGHVGQARADATGLHKQCISSYGVYDMVGNVWEWVDANVSDGMYENRVLPGEGYVSEADADGVPSQVASTPDAAYGGDYFFIEKTGVKGMFRGGFWSMNEKAGLFSINTTSPTSFFGVAVGFRCAKESQ